MTVPIRKYKTLELRGQDTPVLTVILDRPQVRNAFDAAMISELYSVFSSEARSDSIRAVILRGNGPVFCSGGDLQHMVHVAEDEEANRDDARNIAALFYAADSLPKPVIGIVQGAAVGGGLGLVCTCDMVVATQDALFRVSEARLGIVPACIAPFLLAKVGASHTRRLFLSGEAINAEAAQQIGLVHEVAPDLEATEAVVADWTRSILQGSPTAFAIGKRLLLELASDTAPCPVDGLLDYVAGVLTEARGSEDGKEGMKAFLEKRPPRWVMQ